MRLRSVGHQLGKLKAFGGSSGADLGARPPYGPVVLDCFHPGSPLSPARSGALVVQQH